MSKTKDETNSVGKKIESLKELVAWFDSDEFTVEEAVARFKQAETLAVEIETDLTAVKNEVIEIKQRFDTE